MMNLNCPFCDAETNKNFETVTDNPASDFDTHYIRVQCSECSEEYEISYRPVNILYWDEEGEMRTV